MPARILIRVECDRFQEQVGGGIVLDGQVKDRNVEGFWINQAHLRTLYIRIVVVVLGHYLSLIPGPLWTRVNCSIPLEYNAKGHRIVASLSQYSLSLAQFLIIIDIAAATSKF